MTTSRRTGGALVVALLAAVTMGCTSHPKEPEPVNRLDLHEMIAQQVASMSADGPYRTPGRSERDTGRDAYDAILRGELGTADGLLTGLGYQVTDSTDRLDGKPVRIYLADPQTGWPTILLDPSQGINSVVQVPHPAFDINTEKLGLRLYRALPGSMLLIAGAQRKAGDGDADVAHSDRSMFQVFSVVASERGLPQLQLHGFADRSLPGADAVVSTGSAPHSELASRIATHLDGDGLRICRAWVERCHGLEGRTNVQAAAAGDAEFVHLELGWSLRRDLSERDRVRDAIVAAWQN